MAPPRYKLDDGKRAELQLADDQYLAALLMDDGSVHVTLYQQTPEVPGVEQEILEMLAFVEIKGTRVTVVIAEAVDDLHDPEDLLVD